MKRLGNLAVAVLAVAVLAIVTLTPASAQQKTLKDAIAGAWEIVSLIDEYDTGRKNNPWGAGLKGRIMFDGAGQFSQIIIGEKQESMKLPDPRRPDALVVAYFGTYTVNEGDKTISMKLERATNSSRDGSEQKLTVKSSTEDTLVLVGSPRKDQHGTFSPHFELRRAK